MEEFLERVKNCHSTSEVIMKAAHKEQKAIMKAVRRGKNNQRHWIMNTWFLLEFQGRGIASCSKSW
jgi:hypothetical protein